MKRRFISGMRNALAASVWLGTAPVQAEDSADLTSTLTRFEWTLHDARNESGERVSVYFPPKGRPLVLTFGQPGFFSVNGDCNRFSGGYLLSGGRMLKDPSPQSLRTATVIGCDPDSLETDASVIRFFDAEPRFSVRALEGESRLPLLELTADWGHRLEFRGRPTLLERFGSTGHRMDLEVQPFYVPCLSGIPQKVRCLTVREVHELPAVPIPGGGGFDFRFAARGNWHVLRQDIEGFVPRGGVPIVIAVLRFDPTPAVRDDSKASYVLQSVFAADGWFDAWAWQNSDGNWTPPPTTVITQ
jgi:heat shock protein HslJ